ncbi:vacuolar sorting ATPase Vps4, putative [Eimeria praecox]|uniref:Vacuolar sorting ATPase Vps4, putative n=1 Tax=Eimeria praecox TaxID=51316 RepID=U6H3P5_9EIME|nr:vacuolar sorting ATPase Vps4, putative [Eimeria praecox]
MADGGADAEWLLRAWELDADERLRTAIRLSNEAAAKDSAGHLPEAFELVSSSMFGGLGFKLCSLAGQHKFQIFVSYLCHGNLGWKGYGAWASLIFPFVSFICIRIKVIPSRLCLCLFPYLLMCDAGSVCITTVQQNPTLRERLYRRMDDYITRAEQLKQLLRQGSASHLQQRLLLYTASPPKPPCRNSTPAAAVVTPLSRSPASPSFHGTPANASATDSTGTTVKSDADAAEGERIKLKLAHAILTEKPNFRWSDVAGLESAKEALQEAIILPSRFPSLFTGERRPWRGILLYGVRALSALYILFPPGTGKTFLAKALAAEADATILSVSAADLVSKWQGESEKLVRSLFELARERRPSIIFIDEIDSMCGARSESDSESSRRMKTEFLIQMQGINFDLSEVLVLGATNTPWALDAAIRRRFERRIFIPLPKVQAREQLLRSGLGGTPHHLKDADFRHLARELEGFSGSDISVLVRDALFEPIRRCRTATAFKQVMIDGRAFYVPCHPDDPDPTTRKMTLMSVPADRLLPPEVTMEDFHSAMRHTRPSVSQEDLRMHVHWTEQFGLEGS